MSKGFTINDLKKRQDFLLSVLGLCTVTAIRVANRSDPMVPFAAVTGIALAVPVEMIPDDPNDTLDFAFAFVVYAEGREESKRPPMFHEFPELEEWLENEKETSESRFDIIDIPNEEGEIDA